MNPVRRMFAEAWTRGSWSLVVPATAVAFKKAAAPLPHSRACGISNTYYLR